MQDFKNFKINSSDLLAQSLLHVRDSKGIQHASTKFNTNVVYSECISVIVWMTFHLWWTEDGWTRLEFEYKYSITWLVYVCWQLMLCCQDYSLIPQMQHLCNQQLELFHSLDVHCLQCWQHCFHSPQGWKPATH